MDMMEGNTRKVIDPISQKYFTPHLTYIYISEKKVTILTIIVHVSHQYQNVGSSLGKSLVTRNAP